MMTCYSQRNGGAWQAWVMPFAFAKETAALSSRLTNGLPSQALMRGQH